jgi:hypothetical protein
LNLKPAYDFVKGEEYFPVANGPSSKFDHPSEIRGIGLKSFLTALMGLLSILVFGLGCIRNNVLWLWIAFICSLVSGIFVQLLLDRKKNTMLLHPVTDKKTLPHQ